MSGALPAFEQVLNERLIPEFCSDQTRRCETSGFRRASVRLSELDAEYFLKGLDAALVEHETGGRYRTANSAALEQFFWEGPKAEENRWFSLWLEPVITVAALARLHFEYGWPRELIGTQSVDWAFDVVAFRSGQTSEAIAGEVKKTRSEIDHLIRYMTEFGREPGRPIPISGKARNAAKKIVGLRARRAPLFWAVGPAGFNNVYCVHYDSNGIIELEPSDERSLRFVT